MKTFKNIAVILLITLTIIIITLCTTFNILSSPVDKTSQDTITLIIPKGTTISKAGEILEEKGLIRNAKFFLIYAKIYKTSSIKATTYTFTKSMSLSDILKSLEEGNSYNPDEIKITFKEGININSIAKTIEKNTNNTYDDVINKLKDTTYLDEVISTYWFVSDTIKNKDIYYSLEGYLFPDTYYFTNKDVTVEEIFNKMLKRMEEILSPYKTKTESSSMSIHEYLTLASIIDLEGTNASNKKDISSVFYNRLSLKMSLGSDVTAYYGAKVEMSDRELYKSELEDKNAYNTRASNMEGKLPVGPICSMSKEAIEASFNPNETSYLYFVADKNKNIYFTKTYQEHQQKIKELKAKGEWFTW